MAISDLMAEQAESGISEDDRIMHTTKMVERAFGRSVADLGEVSYQDGKAVLLFDYNGKKHALSWERQSSGAIFWYIDGSDRPLVLGQSDRALGRLQAALGG